MSKKFNQIVFIGRFQPVHNAHVAIMRRALELADKVIIVIGSANQPRSVKNPFNVDEREMMIRQAWYKISIPTHLEIVSVEDNVYNDQAWAVAVQEAVTPLLTGEKTGIIGHKKDETSFYLSMFPQWTFIEQEEVEPLHAATIREHYFTKGTNVNFLKGVVPDSTFDFLSRFHGGPEYEYIVGEKEFIDNYKKQFAMLPYPPVFVTADAVVIQSGHVLMVTRRSRPGKGQLAFPGGFLKNKADKDGGPDRSMVDCMLRELEEETKIDVPQKVLRGNIKEAKVFDAIERSARGRTITHAFKIVLADGEWKLPKVKGSDDAIKAEWVPIAKVKRENCFEDHYDILMYFLGSVY